ncbi:hypothetical protein BASA81_000274 [Batrachochytrium salamandrivorans]|nr:hypothetical protein BASA81_000274 [Batrachochytrium salamandrivorans]
MVAAAAAGVGEDSPFVDSPFSHRTPPPPTSLLLTRRRVLLLVFGLFLFGALGLGYKSSFPSSVKENKSATPSPFSLPPPVRTKKPTTHSPTPKSKRNNKKKTPEPTIPMVEEEVDDGDEEEKNSSIVEEEEKNSPIVEEDSELAEAEEYSEEEQARERDSEEFVEGEGEVSLEEEEEEEEEEETGEEMFTAPRSKPSLEYNEIKPRGVLYWPSGGMSNQILEMENALQMAHFLNRTLYVSQIGSHNYLMQGYSNLKNYQLFPADRLLDLDIMSKWADVVPLNVSTKRFVRMFPQADVFPVKSAFASFGPYKLTELKQRTEPLLLWSGAGMWHRWFSKPTMLLAEHHTAYSPYLRDLAIRLANKAMNNQPFYAIHGRLGDETHFWEGKTSREAFMYTNTFRSWDKGLKIYLASDCPTCSFFKALRATKRVVTLDDLVGLDEMHEFSALFTNAKVRRDMMGILDKLVCIQAVGFMGSKFSTFTWDIMRSRNMRRFVFPELLVNASMVTP